MINRRKGFTLAELIVYLALLGIILSIGYNLFFYGNSTFTNGSAQFQLQSELRLAGDFIIKETRNSTELDIISIPFTAESGYSYIYFENSKIIYEHDGSKTEKTGSVVADQNIFIITKDTNNKNFLGIDLHGSINNQTYELTTSILLNNIINESNQSGKAIKYKAP